MEPDRAGIHIGKEPGKVPEICLVCEGEALGLSRHCRDETRRVQDGWEKEDRCRGLCDHWIKQIFTESD